MLNRYDRPSPMAGEAEVKYLDGDFRIVRPGAFVRCAVTGVPIPLEELKYWSVERQEAYASPEAVMRRLHPEQAQVARGAQRRRANTKSRNAASSATSAPPAAPGPLAASAASIAVAGHPRQILLGGDERQAVAFGARDQDRAPRRAR